MTQVEETSFPNNGLEPFRQQAHHDDLVGYFNQCFSIAKGNRLQFEKQWYTNLAFYFGRQYVVWTTSGPLMRLYEPAAPSWRVRLVTNHVRRYVRKEKAKITQEQPTGFVIPASTEDGDVLAARAGDAIIEHEWREKKVNDRINSGLFWACLTGNGFLKDEWDSTKKDITVSTVNPFHLYVPDITVESIDEQDYIIQAMSMNRWKVKELWGVDLPAEGSYSGGALEDKFLQAMGINQNQQKDLVYVKQIWFHPGGKFKNGCVAIWAGDRMLEVHEDAWPVPYPEYPYTKIDHISTGRFYSECAVTDLIPLQKEYNRTRSQIVEAKNKTAAPQMVAQEGSTDVNKWTSEPGLVLFYKPGYEAPKALEKPNLPSYVLQEADNIKTDMDDIASQHEVSRGQTPPGIEAATAISYLQEQDDSSLSDVIRSKEAGAEKVGRHILAHVNKNWDQPRKIKVVGLNNQIEAFEFSKANLDGNTDYTVQAGSAIPRSAAAKRAFITDMMDKQWIPPQLGLRYLELSEVGKLYEELQIDVRHAQRENVQISRMEIPQAPQMPPGFEQINALMGMMGQAPMEQPQPEPMQFPINTWDNHQAHIFEHDNYRKRQEYETLDPQIRAVYEDHINAHKMYFISLYGYTLPPGTPTEVVDSVYYRVTNGIPIEQPNALDTGTGQQTQQGSQQQQPAEMG